MFCTNCGNLLQEGQTSCPVCGMSIDLQSTDEGTKKNDFKGIFSDKNEEYVTSLGNTYMQNFLFDGSIKKGFAVVSNKRVYFKGTTYTITTTGSGNKRPRRFKSSRVIDLCDVTGTGCENIINILALIRAYLLYLIPLSIGGIGMTGVITSFGCGEIGVGLLFVLLFLPVVLMLFGISILIKIIKTKTYIIIQYAGGEIAFDSKWFTSDEIERFQQELRIAKDTAISNKENAVANQLQQAINHNNAGNTAGISKADELLKYAELLSKGLISQEEFESIKRDMLS